MYRAIVVDDEIWSVIGLKRILEEDAGRFQMVYETTDSMDALERICAMRPDVVFTDVRMPEMSGIELMRNVRQRGVQTEFVVISGFAEFSYVQQALREGAIDYQLKPFDRATAQQMLDKVFDRLESKRSFSDLEFYAQLRDKKDHAAQLLRERFGGVLYQRLQVALVHRNSSEGRAVTLEPGDGDHRVSLKIGPRKWICIVNSEDDRTEALLCQLRWRGGEVERAALSSVGVPDAFEQLLKEAEAAVLDAFVYPREKIFLYRGRDRQMVNQLYERLTALHHERKFTQVAALVDRLPHTFAQRDIGTEDFVELWNKLAFSSGQWAREPYEVLEYLDAYELTDRFPGIREACGFLNAKYEHKTVEPSGRANDKFYEMLRYIDENYSEHLSLKELCGKFYINMSYCCELFQRHKSMTFSQYLTDVRLGKACDLLRFHRSTVAEACELVGYKDYFYFNKVFKKKMGCTPAEYRKQVLTEE